MASRSGRFLAALTASTLAALGAVALPPALSASAATRDSVFVSEIVANNASYDNYEWLELHNPSGAAVDLADYQLAYTYGDSDDTSGDVALTIDDDVTLASGETIVLWLSYTNADGTLDSFARTEAEFRTHTGTPETARVVRITGQPGMANGGDRGIRVTAPDGDETRSFYPAGSMGNDLSTTFRLPAEAGQRSYPVLATLAEPTPGTLDPESLVPADPEPGPDPEPQPGPDPDLITAPLQVTEILPDSTNVGTADGYEFIELYNATSEPVDFSDYALTYLYPQDTTTNTNEAHWPSVPRDVTIESGGTLVLWVKNGQNDDLGDAEFNAQFGTELTLGTDLVEVFVGGMANGSPRGVEIRTNTGFGINRAYYNMTDADDTSADQGIRYAVNPEDLSLQTLVDTAPATPGAVQADQVPDGLMIVPEDTVAPVIEGGTADEIDPAEDFTLEFTLTDDVQVRTATLTLTNDVDDAPREVSLTHGPDDRYTHTVTAADLTGKSWYEYTLTITDGANEVTTEAVRVPIAGAVTDPVRLNVTDGEFVSGTTTISAAGETYPPELELSIDDAPVSTEPSLEDAPLFVFEVSQTDFYFRNGVRIGEDVLFIFDEGTYSNTETMSTPVPLEYLTQGEDVTVSVWAGTKAAPEIDENENNDDFVISGMRLILPDGRTLTPAGYDDPNQTIAMGDSTGKHDFYDSVFTLPDDAYTALAHEWDTTAVADGEHTVRAIDGDDEASAAVLVDNTAPQVTPSVNDGQTYQGEIVLDAQVSDGAGAGVESTTATLDGEQIELPHTTSSVELEAGDHELIIEAADGVGNVTESVTTFVVPDEEPLGTGTAPADGAQVPAGDVTLTATVSDPTGDPLDVQFRQGYRYELGDDEVTASQGTTRDAAAIERDGAVLATADLSTQAGLDPVTSSTALPYTQFDVQVPAEAGDAADVRLAWEGTANADSQVILYALSADGAAWVEVDRHHTQADGEEISLGGTVAAGDHATEGAVTVLVQHSEGFAGADLSDRDDTVEPYHPDDTPRSEYDFTIGWESDTQYYNEEFYEHQVAIHDYLLGQREDMNLQYVIHTGDIVDEYDQPYQWENADPQYARFDEAALPYGVLAGNHDVGNQLADYSVYSEYFGEDRFSGNPWYGESFQDNRGHYDLISAGGIDFLMLYMGWDPGQDAIDWMNEVLARHPERVAIVNLHEFMLTTGGLGPIPQQIMDEVVATNPNVRMVFSGHYHDAFTRIDGFDDDGDGVEDRNVYSMLFDYQGLPEGGLGYLRMLQFDNDGEQMRVRTFSPSEDRYNSDDPNLLGSGEDPYEFQDFEVSYDELRIDPDVKELVTDSFTAEVLGETVIASFEDVATDGSQVGAASADGQRSVARMPIPHPDGSMTLSATWTLTEPGEYGWFVESADDNGGVNTSAVRTFVVVGSDGSSSDGSDDAGSDGSGSDGSGSDGSGSDGSGSDGSGSDGTGADGTGSDGSGSNGTGADGSDSSDGQSAGDGDLATTGPGPMLALLSAAAALVFVGAVIRRRQLRTA
ncbi:lamin tail domain-containing protein [Ruania halotolerans]|uniref:lamin tail domain-containing protein n=1 Tax=Ruania halotolerans TaxID=2897773 RepID=UPI001E500A51|nr:lamin tail domain-containing protein [Ruania halotolerans]UFU08028.1 lamin tail domain-containing protein [Ruania halotolerans]